MCDFHRKQAWERWLNTVANCMQSHEGMILAYLKRIAHLKTEEAYNQNKKDLIGNDIWNMVQAQKLRQWLNNKWFPSYKV